MRTAPGTTAVPSHEFFELRKRLESARGGNEGRVLTPEKKKILRGAFFVAL